MDQNSNYSAEPITNTPMLVRSTTIRNEIIRLNLEHPIFLTPVKTVSFMTSTPKDTTVDKTKKVNRILFNGAMSTELKDDSNVANITEKANNLDLGNKKKENAYSKHLLKSVNPSMNISGADRSWLTLG